MSKQLSVAKDIEALALINIQDIFRFTITATDEEIEDRYGSEARAIEVAEKYLEIAMRASVLEYDLKGWSMKYSVPIKGKNERIEKTAYFYDMADRKTEPLTCSFSDCDNFKNPDYARCIECKRKQIDRKTEPQTEVDAQTHMDNVLTYIADKYQTTKEDLLEGLIKEEPTHPRR